MCCAETGPHSTRRRLCICASLGPPEKKKNEKRKRTDKRINPTDGRGGGGGCGDNHRRRRLSYPRVCVLHRHVRYGRRRSVSLSRFRFFFVVIIIFKTYSIMGTIYASVYIRTFYIRYLFSKIFHYFTRT